MWLVMQVYAYDLFNIGSIVWKVIYMTSLNQVSFKLQKLMFLIASEQIGFILNFLIHKSYGNITVT